LNVINSKIKIILNLPVADRRKVAKHEGTKKDFLATPVKLNKFSAIASSEKSGYSIVHSKF